MKNLSIVIVCLLLTISSFGQNMEDVNPEWRNFGDIEFGVLLGFTTNTASVDNDFTDDSDPSGNSFLVGAMMDNYFNKNWSIRTRANFENRDFGFGADANYLSLSVNANWHFGKNRRWNLQLGPNYSYNLDNSNSSSFGSDFGIGVIIPISGMRFFIELDGVTDFNAGRIVFTDINGNVIGSENVRINRSSISFGVHF